MTATMTQACNALASTLSSISGLETHGFPVGNVTPPAAVVGTDQGDFLTYRVTMDATHDLDLVIGLFVKWGEDQSAFEALDAYIADAGAYSIYAAVEADPTLGGVVDHAWVETARNRGPYTYGGVQYLGCEFPVRVLL